VVAKYCDEHVCVCVSVRLSLCGLISGATCVIITNFFVHVAYGHGSVLLWHSYEIPREGAVLGFFLPIDNAYPYKNDWTDRDAVWGNDSDLRYHVLDGDLIPQGEGVVLEGNVAAHCKVMRHSTVICAKTAVLIDMLFWMRTRVGPGTMYEMGCRSGIPSGKWQFLGVVRAIQKHWQSLMQLSVECRCHVSLQNIIG